jgi:uncharacterized membrane protein
LYIVGIMSFIVYYLYIFYLFEDLSNKFKISLFIITFLSLLFITCVNIDYSNIILYFKENDINLHGHVSIDK